MNATISVQLIIRSIVFVTFITIFMADTVSSIWYFLIGFSLVALELFIPEVKKFNYIPRTLCYITLALLILDGATLIMSIVGRT